MKSISLKKLLFISIIIITALIFAPQSAKAELGDLEVVFSHDPLFTEIGIVPGDTASETITVTNTTDEEKTVGIEFIGTSTYELDNMLYFSIKENGNTIYGGPADPKTLAELLTLGEISLTHLLPNSTTVMTIDAYFDTQADNPYQLKASVFDIKVGFIYFEKNDFIIPETNTNTPIVLGVEIINKQPPPAGTILGIELPITGGQLLTYSLLLISVLLFLLFSISTLFRKRKSRLDF